MKSITHFCATNEVFYCDEILLEVPNESSKVIETKLLPVDRDFPRRISTERPRFEIVYYKEVECGNYQFRFTLINKCTGAQYVYTENTRYHCQFN